MKQFSVTGMSCAACSARVEKAVSKVEGVQSCSVSLLTNSMGVEGTATVEQIVRAVEHAGYHAAVKSQEQERIQTQSTEGQREDTSEEELLKDNETPALRRRLLLSVGFLAILMYLSMGHMMWGWPVPEVLAINPLAQGLLQMILAAIVMVINRKFFVSGWNGMLHGAPNMDTLVALGSAAAFVYSVAALFMMTGVYVTGHVEHAHMYMHEFYFESAAMILTLITVGKMLEARSKGRTTDALKSLMKLAPKTAVVIRNEEEVTIPASQVHIGDLFVVRPGEQIPADGVVLEGISAVDESALSGESIPVDKEAGSEVSQATVNQSGFLKCQATRVGRDTTLSQIIQMVSDAAATKAPIAKVADKVSGVFVPIVIGISLVTFVLWMCLDAGVGYALARSISVLVISCPCALGLATPVAIMVGNGMGAKHGIMFKTATSLEVTGKTQIVALDKTGTITSGEPKVTDVMTADHVTIQELLYYAYALEQPSEHPLAKAIVEYGREQQVPAATVTQFEALPGNGLTAMLDGAQLLGGSFAFVSQKIKLTEKLEQEVYGLSEEGKTPLLFAKDEALLGIIAVQDTMKEDSKQAVEELKNLGLRVVMLTGDNRRTALHIAAKAGVEEVIADVRPDGKERVIAELKMQGKVMMVGDGINDAPALTSADIGVAIGAGTDIAIDAADVVLMKNSLRDVAAAIRLSRATLRNIHENLFWAFIYNVIGIPLAAGVWIPIFGWELNPMFGAAAMSLSSFCVVSNALRLNLCKLYKDHAANEIINNQENIKEDLKMEVTMKIEGMMCGHCEARVKKCLEALPEVEAAIVSHETDSAVVKLAQPLDKEVLKKTVEAQDYTVTSID